MSEEHSNAISVCPTTWTIISSRPASKLSAPQRTMSSPIGLHAYVRNKTSSNPILLVQ